MSRPPYRGFTPLNRRRGDLIRQEYEGGGLSEDEKRELKMLTRIVNAMIDYRYPMRDGSLEELEALVEKCRESRR